MRQEIEMHGEEKREREQKHNGYAGESWGRYCANPQTMEFGNVVELLIDGAQAYPAMLQEIGRAQKTILMDSYIFNDDAAGRLFSSALCDAAERGVLVYLIVDGVGTRHVPSAFFEKMRRAGLHVLVYRSPAPWGRSFGLFRRDHRKMLVTDGSIGFAGGINIGAEWLSRESGGLGWHDLHLRIEGPAVRELSKLAISTWHINGRILLDSKRFLPEIPKKGAEHVSIIGSRERKKRKVIRRSYLQAIRQARIYIYITNAYFLPDAGFRRAMKNACRRGVDVRVMVPEKGDIPIVDRASQAIYSRLLKAGIRIFLWKSDVLHAKSAAIDGEWATVGSFNIDHRSWRMNLEVNVNAVGANLSGQLRDLFLKDQAHCGELTLEEWRKRPFITKLFQWFFHLFRKLM
jgi:cardiolipin synthase A/B